MARTIETNFTEEDKKIEGSLRPQYLTDYIGQEKVKEKLKIKYYSRYMDDCVLIHHDKDYLKHCLEQMKQCADELKIDFNEKTEIFPLKNGASSSGTTMSRRHFCLLSSLSLSPGIFSLQRRSMSRYLTRPCSRILRTTALSRTLFTESIRASSGSLISRST